jgi:hypothetical protein
MYSGVKSAHRARDGPLPESADMVPLDFSRLCLTNSFVTSVASALSIRRRT